MMDEDTRLAFREMWEQLHKVRAAQAYGRYPSYSQLCMEVNPFGAPERRAAVQIIPAEREPERDGHDGYDRSKNLAERYLGYVITISLQDMQDLIAGLGAKLTYEQVGCHMTVRAFSCNFICGPALRPGDWNVCRKAGLLLHVCEEIEER